MYDKYMKRFKLQNLMSQNKSQLISFILYKPLQVTLSRNTSVLNVEKVPKRKRQHVNSIKWMNVNMQDVYGNKFFFFVAISKVSRDFVESFVFGVA